MSKITRVLHYKPDYNSFLFLVLPLDTLSFGFCSLTHFYNRFYKIFNMCILLWHWLNCFLIKFAATYPLKAGSRCQHHV